MKTRIISAIVALLITVPLIILGGVYFEIGIGVLAALAFKEIVDLPKSHGKYPKFIIVFGLLGVLFLILSNTIDTSLTKGFTYQVLAAIILFLIMPIIFVKNESYTSKDAIYLIGIVLFLGLSFNLLNIVRLRSLKTFIFLICIPMVNDIFAYLIGSKFGKNKMCPSISPKKTWEGSIGGLVLGTLVGSIIHYYLLNSFNLKILLLIVVLSAVGQIGDLIMSKIKRENEIKDFSNIMPGHGGILDRLDSTIFVFIAYILMTWI